MTDVSVIIPTWNRSASIEKAVRSALSQTLPPLEVLVCDDGSSDDSQEVVRAICDPRVRWIDGSHSGLPAVPRNRGIAAARGEWLAFLDSDDEWLPNKLQTQFDLIDSLKCSAACTNALRYIPGKGNVGEFCCWRHPRITLVDLLEINHVICSSVIVKKSIVINAGGFPVTDKLAAVEDYSLWMKVAIFTDFAFTTTPLLVYRDDQANSIRVKKMGYWNQKLAVLGHFLTWSLKYDKRNVLNKRIMVAVFHCSECWILFQVDTVVKKCQKLALMLYLKIRFIDVLLNTLKQFVLLVAFRFKNRKGLLIYAGLHEGSSFDGIFTNYERCYGFEANPEIFEKLIVKYKRYPHVHLFNVAVSSHDGKTDFNISNMTASSSIGQFDKEFGGGLTIEKTISVPTVNLYNFLTRHGIDFVDDYISDIQGMDLEVLKTLKPFIQARKIGTITCEVTKNKHRNIYNDLPDNNETGFHDLLHEHYELVATGWGILKDGVFSAVPDHWWEMDCKWKRRD